MSSGGPAVNALVELFLVLAVLVMAVKLLMLNAWRAVLFVYPDRVRLLPDASAERMELPPELVARGEQLRALGFRPLGVHLEKSPLRRGFRSYDFVHPEERVFATLHLSSQGQPRLYLLTPLAPRGFELTADSKRLAFDVPGLYRAVGMPECPPELLLQAHRLRVREVCPAEDFTWEGRLQAGRDWYQGPGAQEIRRQNLPGLLWTLVALAIVVSLFLGGERAV
ncbi:hypothetical protein [Cystobacter ferrugineus]|uniref:hypothetical protein n=1 Tax=Cystobacter ferrugineus TaxID=83449 RepID=UPI000AAF177D|nr:hypothetical protein [Cystobacter ferrugineus]